jgi:PIN domain nuclease of toxin-antitoxin system
MRLLLDTHTFPSPILPGFHAPFHHEPPFDRLIIAQSLVEWLPLVSIDTIFDHCGVQRLW